MVKCGREKRIILSVLIVCLCFSLVISSGCKKKDQSDEARQAVSEKAKKTSVSKEVESARVFEKINLRILYVGQPNIERSKDFIDFLSDNFKKVTAVDKKAFDQDRTTEFDVILLDQIIRIKREYSRPAVTIGGAGAKIGDYLDLKTGYL